MTVLAAAKGVLQIIVLAQGTHGRIVVVVAVVDDQDGLSLID
jgi:hypothetical protein